MNEIADVSVAFLVADGERGCGAIALFGLLTTSELGVEIAEDELKEWIRRVFFREWMSNLEGLLVLLIVVVKADGEVEASLRGRENTFGDGALQLLNAFLFVAAGNAHEETEDACSGREGVGVIVVKAESGVSVGELGVERDRAQETFTGANASTRAIAIFSAQAVKAGEQCVAHAGVELHFGGVLLRDLGLGEGGGFGGEFQVVLVGRELGAMPRIAHAVFEFGGGAPDFPPEGFGFEKIAERVSRLIGLEAAGAFDGRG